MPRARHARNAFESGRWRYGKSFVRLKLIPLVVPTDSVGNCCRVCGLSVSAERSKSVEELVATLCVTSLKQQHSESELARLLMPSPWKVSIRITIILCDIILLGYVYLAKLEGNGPVERACELMMMALSQCYHFLTNQDFWKKFGTSNR